MAEKEKVTAEAPVATESAAPTTVPVEEYNKLYQQAVELETRYRRLFEAYNALLEQYLTKK